MVPVTEVLFAPSNEVTPLRGHRTHAHTDTGRQGPGAAAQCWGTVLPQGTSGRDYRLWGQQAALRPDLAGTLTWDLKLCQLLQESCPKAVQKLSFSTEAENKLPED